MKDCKNCLFLSDSSFCLRIQGTISFPDEVHNCPFYINKESARICRICGQSILASATYDSVAFLTFCPTCSAKYGTCELCKNAVTCAFEEDPNPLPKVIMKTFKQGNMVIQQQVQNPERIAETCGKLCHCYSEEFGCLRQYGNCNKFETII